MTSSDIGPLVLDVLAGVGILLAGIGIMLGMRALAATLARVNITLDRVNQQVNNLSAPVTATLTHVDGIANTADQTLARLSGVVQSLEDVAGNVSQTAQIGEKCAFAGDRQRRRNLNQRHDRFTTLGYGKERFGYILTGVAFI